jgi:hypothetical protein
VPSIPHRLAQLFVVAVLQRVHQREHPLQVENRIAPRHVFRQRRPRLGRRESDGRRRNHEPQIGGPRPLERERLGAFALEHRVQPAEQRRRGVVGMAFDGGCRRQQSRIRYRLRHALEQTKTGNGRGRAASQTGRHRDVTFDFHEYRRRRQTRSARDTVERLLERVLPVDCGRASRHDELGALVVADIRNRRAQIQLNGHAECVETAAQIGD